VRTAPLLLLVAACTSEADPSGDATGGAKDFGSGVDGATQSIGGAGAAGGQNIGGSNVAGASSNGGVGVAGAIGNGGAGASGSGGSISAGGIGAGGSAGAGGASGGGGVSGAGGVDAGSGGSTVCGTATENGALRLSCPAGQIVDHVVFASYGTPSGSCGSFSIGTCDAATSTSAVESLCVGRSTCVVPATNATFGDPCRSTVKTLAVSLSCVPGQGPPPEPFKGVANSPCAARTALGVSWYYNWEQAEREPCSDGRGGTFVPMIWGHPQNEQNTSAIASSISSFVAGGYEYVLGFNEPDNSTQSNISVSTALSLWSSFDNPSIKVGSPATQANTTGQAWFSDFVTQLDANPSLRADFLAAHWYGWNTGSCDANASQLEGYVRWLEGLPGGRPIWLTEWGCLNQSAPDVDTVVRFFNAALAVFDRHPRVVRYAWYPWSTNNGLVNGDGSLTPLGAAYAAAPATR
jgi:hypothetical protein